MTLQLPSTPKSKKELFARLKAVLGQEYEILAECKGGSGAPGRMLELLLGSEGRSKNIADSVGTEIKFKTPAPTLLTLFHKEVSGGDKSLSTFVYEFGQLDKEGRISFRCTVRDSDRFRVARVGGRIVVRSRVDESKELFWCENVLTNTASKKMNDLVLVTGRTETRDGIKYVRFEAAQRMTDLKITNFLNALAAGYVVVDFDARQKTPATKVLRNHGTKFRMRLEDIKHVWATIQDHTTIDRWQAR